MSLHKKIREVAEMYNMKTPNTFTENCAKTIINENNRSHEQDDKGKYKLPEIIQSEVLHVTRYT